MTEQAVATIERPIDLALLKAVGLDRLAPEQRALAMNIANRYELDLLLKHLVMIDGRPYITRDGLLHVAHRSGQLDGIETTIPSVVDGFWRASCSVYRKDMSRPFTYGGRYPTVGGNQKFAPEMAIKVAEVQALRRAFDVSAPTLEERWDLEAPTEEPAKPPTLRERVSSRAAEIAPEPTGATETAAEFVAEGTATLMDSVAQETPRVVGQCGDASPYGDGTACVLTPGHKGNHKAADRSTWIPR